MTSTSNSGKVAQLASQKAKSKKRKSCNYLPALYIVLGIVITVVAIYVAKKYNFSEISISLDKKLKYWTISMSNWNPNGSLRSMERVFEKLNIIKSDKNDWDIVWSIEGPGIAPYDKIKKFKRHQKINHFPGNTVLVTKLYLNMFNEEVQYILPTFQFPDDKEKLKSYVAEHPKAKFVRKNMFNRGVEVIEVKDMGERDREEFYQVFLDRPFLIDGHAFDLGVFVLITSINPLRIYKYDHEVLLRFCPKKYYPFNPKDVEKYVVQDGHKSFYEMDSFGPDHWKYKATMKNLFERHLKNQGRNVTRMWEQIDDAITTLIRNSEGPMVQETANTKHSIHNFFELVRFDFMVDEDLNVFVMEVNMSPNMTPAEPRFEPNSLIYEPLIYTTLKMVGAGSYYEFMSRFTNDTTIINIKNLVTNIDACIKNDCENSCSKPQCQLCLPCLNPDQIYQIRESFREWKHQGEFVRLYPRSQYRGIEPVFEYTVKENEFMINWFHSMCIENPKWC